MPARTRRNQHIGPGSRHRNAAGSVLSALSGLSGRTRPYSPKAFSPALHRRQGVESGPPAWLRPCAPPRLRVCIGVPASPGEKCPSADAGARAGLLPVAGKGCVPPPPCFPPQARPPPLRSPGAGDCGTQHAARPGPPPVRGRRPPTPPASVAPLDHRPARPASLPLRQPEDWRENFGQKHASIEKDFFTHTICSLQKRAPTPGADLRPTPPARHQHTTPRHGRPWLQTAAPTHRRSQHSHRPAQDPRRQQHRTQHRHHARAGHNAPPPTHTPIRTHDTTRKPAPRDAWPARSRVSQLNFSIFKKGDLSDLADLTDLTDLADLGFHRFEKNPRGAGRLKPARQPQGRPAAPVRVRTNTAGQLCKTGRKHYTRDPRQTPHLPTRSAT